MSTRKQIAANRRNAGKSTGPKTAAGKDRANAFMGLATSHGPFVQLSRHETTIERSYHRALHDLERLQARRKGEAVIAPLAVDVSSDD
jgi:hypothetical protein